MAKRTSRRLSQASNKATDHIGQLAMVLDEARETGYDSRDIAEALARTMVAVADWSHTEAGDMPTRTKYLRAIEEQVAMRLGKRLLGR